MAKIELCGEVFEVSLEVAKYNNGGGVAVALIEKSGEPFATLSVNLPESSILPEGAFYAKHWNENTGLVEQLLAQGLIVPVDALFAQSGMVGRIKAYRLA